MRLKKYELENTGQELYLKMTSIAFTCHWLKFDLLFYCGPQVLIFFNQHFKISVYL